MDKRDVKPGDIRTAWLGQGFTRKCKVLSVDDDGLCRVVYPEYPRKGVDYVLAENLS